LVIHGDRDEIVPFWIGQRLARELPDATLLRVSGAHHGDLFSYAGTTLVERIARFSGV
jgi:pimeloyl-ACP methyl ester carboxylesterase